MEDTRIKEMIAEAYKAKEHSYAPYSGFHVGAALLTDAGKIYQGCNIENAAYSPTNCAERTAIFKAVSSGETKFRGIAIVGDKNEYLAPCGVCRQVMIEFADPEVFEVILAKSKEEYSTYRLEELLPLSFSVKDM